MNNAIRVTYLRDEVQRPIGCVVIQLHRAKGLIDYQYTVQNPRDDFNRKIGRQLAIGRLVEDPISIIINKDADMHDISHAVMSDLLLAKDTPTRAFKAAKSWLNGYGKVSLKVVKS